MHTAEAFVLVGGGPALELVATFGRRHAGGVERIPDPDTLARWFVVAGVLDGPPPVTEADLELARRLREAIAALVHSMLGGRPVDHRAVRTVNTCAEHPDVAPRLHVGPAGRLAGRPGPGSAVAALAGIARNAVRLLGGPQAGRIKVCAHPDCSLVFLDETQGGRRRWCSMERCGNLVKTAGYRTRTRRAGPVADAASSPPRAGT